MWLRADVACRRLLDDEMAEKEEGLRGLRSWCAVMLDGTKG